jgi:hypothetical protein
VKPELKVHWASAAARDTGQCHVARRTYPWQRSVTVEPAEVTCLVCLYHMGRYMPLSKLQEHQEFARMHHYAWGNLRPSAQSDTNGA